MRPAQKPCQAKREQKVKKEEERAGDGSFLVALR